MLFSQNRNRTGFRPSRQLKDSSRIEQRVQLAASGSHQKSPIYSDGGNEEWETASETSDHGGDNKQQQLEKSGENYGDKLERQPRRGGKLISNIRPSRKIGKPQKGEGRKTDIGRNRKSASETPNMCRGEMQSEDMIQQEKPPERQQRKPPTMAATHNQYQQRIAGQKNVNPASHTNQSSFEVIFFFCIFIPNFRTRSQISWLF